MDQAGHLQAFFLGALCQAVGHILDRVAQVKVDRLQFKFACLDLGEVQDVVKQRQQNLGALKGNVYKIALLIIKRRIQGQFQHADHAIHGCPDLMAHICQEFALGVVGQFRFAAGGFQFLSPDDNGCMQSCVLDSHSDLTSQPIQQVGLFRSDGGTVRTSIAHLKNTDSLIPQE